MTDSPPRVSIVIPTYNNAHFLPAAIASCRAQSFDSCEVIVVDDGSTDHTREVLAGCEDQVKVLSLDHSGVCRARNAGIEAARGEYVAFLDADDYFLPDKLARQVACFEANPGLAIVHSGWRVVDAAGRELAPVEPWRVAPRLELQSWLIWKPVFPGAMMFRREALLKVGGFDPQFRQAEDVELVFRLALDGCAAEWVKIPTVCYRQHGANTVKRYQQQADNMQRVLNKFFGLPDLPDRYRRLEPRIRYYTAMWLAWQIFLYGGAEETIEVLRPTLKWSFYSPDAFVVLDWLAQMMAFASRQKKPLECVRGLWPSFRAASGLPPVAWAEAEAYLETFYTLWWYYMHREWDQAARQMAGFRHSARELVRWSYPCIYIGPLIPTEEMVGALWRDAQAAGVVSRRERPKVTWLYLTIFSRMMFAQSWGAARRAFWAALKAGWHPRAALIWLRYAKVVAGYLSRRIFLGKR